MIWESSCRAQDIKKFCAFDLDKEVTVAGQTESGEGRETNSKYLVEWLSATLLEIGSEKDRDWHVPCQE